MQVANYCSHDFPVSTITTIYLLLSLIMAKPECEIIITKRISHLLKKEVTTKKERQTMNLIHAASLWSNTTKEHDA